MRIFILIASMMLVACSARLDIRDYARIKSAACETVSFDDVAKVVTRTPCRYDDIVRTIPGGVPNKGIVKTDRYLSYTSQIPHAISTVIIKVDLEGRTVTASTRPPVPLSDEDFQTFVAAANVVWDPPSIDSDGTCGASSPHTAPSVLYLFDGRSLAMISGLPSGCGPLQAVLAINKTLDAVLQRR